MDSFTRDDLTFETLDRGPEDGEAVVLLHGFPQYRGSWAGVAEVLARHGYRVLAPDQRGYSPGARPAPRRAYRVHELAEDALTLIDAAHVGRAHLVGHDWGATVAWTVAARAPHRLLSLTAVSTPHPTAIFRTLLTSRQMRSSWYLFFFQVPRLPERVVLGKGGRFGVRLLERTGLDRDTARAYMDRLLSDPGLLTGALNWYRALPRDIPFDLTIGPVRVPTLYVRGTDDVSVSRRAAELTETWVAAPYGYEALAGATHWIPEQAPEELAMLILRHVKANAPPSQ